MYPCCRLYHSYCLNFDSALDRLALWKSFKSANAAAPSNQGSPHFAQKSTIPVSTAQRKRIKHLLKDARRHPRHDQIDLQSYLLMPIQRIPRYRMLLESLMECTPSQDLPGQSEPVIVSAFECIATLATELNERKRDNEGRKRLVSHDIRIDT